MPVNKYLIASMTVVKDVKLFLLAVDSNVTSINHSIIPADQRKHIGKYHKPHDRNKRFLARSFLYELIMETHQTTDFELGFNSFGRPYLINAEEINFSFSYAKDYVLVGVARNRIIGVDIEFVDTAIQLSELVNEIMSDNELLYFRSMDTDEDRFLFFFKTFSGKESIIKAFGTGLSFPVKNLNLLNTNTFRYNQTEFQYRALSLGLKNYAIAITHEHTFRDEAGHIA